LGLTVDEACGPPVEIWPDSERAVSLFIELCTQWRIGPNGPVGLDYNVLFHKIDRMNLKRKDYDLLESQVRTMEDEALNVIWKRKD